MLTYQEHDQSNFPFCHFLILSCSQCFMPLGQYDIKPPCVVVVVVFFCWSVYKAVFLSLPGEYLKCIGFSYESSDFTAFVIDAEASPTPPLDTRQHLPSSFTNVPDHVEFVAYELAHCTGSLHLDWGSDNGRGVILSLCCHVSYRNHFLSPELLLTGGGGE